MATKALNGTRLQRVEHYCSSYAVVVEEGTTIDMVQEPGFWVHVWSKLRRMDTIRVLPEDESYFAELLVLSAGQGWAKVHVLRHVELDDAPAETGDESLAVEWKGPHRRYAVIRKTDGQILRDGFVKKTDAANWRRDHSAALAA